VKTAKHLPRESWSDQRLDKLFRHYNAVYWKNRLATFLMFNKELPWGLGIYFPDLNAVVIDVSKHRSDRHVRSTVLHEMCHIAAGGPGHNSRFMAQAERLLRLKAPIAVGVAEAQMRVDVNAVAIPAKFKLCRRAIKREAARLQRAVEAHGDKPVTISLTKDQFVAAFYNAAAKEGLTWQQASLELATPLGCFDIDGNPIDVMKGWIGEARKAHRKGRRYWLAIQRARRSLGLVD
jgi:hypothetical protein